MNQKQIEPKGIMKIVRVVLGWIFGKPKKEKPDGKPRDSKDKIGGYNSID